MSIFDADLPERLDVKVFEIVNEAATTLKKTKPKLCADARLILKRLNPSIFKRASIYISPHICPPSRLLTGQ